MINLLKIYDPILQKVRIGNHCDGGYVIALQSICRSSALFSYGVGSDISFEKAYVNATGKMVYCYDHTINDIHIEERYIKNIIYAKEGLSAEKLENTDNFLSHYKNLNINDRVLLKVDVEGSEFDYILNTNIEELSKITTGLIFEFHYLQDPLRNQKFFDCMKKLNEYFYLCHLHGNNYANSFVHQEKQESYIKEYSVPEVVELSFVNKDLVEYQMHDIKSYPSEFLDRRNNLSREDLDLSFLKLL